MKLWNRMIDRLALMQLHKVHSVETQFASIPELEGVGRQEFYKANPTSLNMSVQYSDALYRTGTYSFQSPIHSEYSVNNIVKGEFLLSANKQGAPNVIFVHGWRMDSLDRSKAIFENRIVDLGWNQYYFTLPYHFDRKPKQSLYSGEFMISANITRTVQSVRQAVVDLRTLIDWLKHNKRGPVFIVGISLGGVITNLAATVEPRIDAVVSIFYANRLAYSIWHTIPGKYIKADLKQHGVTYDELLRHWKITEPGQSKPAMTKDNILLISADHDLYVHREDADDLWESWDQPRRYIYKCGHAGIVLCRKTIAQDTLAFLQEKARG